MSTQIFNVTMSSTMATSTIKIYNISVKSSFSVVCSIFSDDEQDQPAAPAVVDSEDDVKPTKKGAKKDKKAKNKAEQRLDDDQDSRSTPDPGHKNGETNEQPQPAKGMDVILSIAKTFRLQIMLFY